MKKKYTCPSTIMLSMMTDEMMVSIGASRQAYGQANESEWSSDDDVQQQESSSRRKNDLWVDPSETQESKVPSLW